MLKKSRIYTNKTKSLAMLLVLFFVVLGSCSLKKVVAHFAAVDTELVKQVKQQAALTIVSDCAVDILKAKDISVPFLFVTVLGAALATFFRTYSVSFNYLRIRLRSPVPLFLKYNTLII